MEPPSLRTSNSSRPKKKFSLRNLRARFGSTSNVDINEDLIAATEWNKLPTHSPYEPYSYETIFPYTYSPSNFSSATSSPTAASHVSNREREKSLPRAPPVPNRSASSSAAPPKRKSPAVLSVSDETNTTHATTNETQSTQVEQSEHSCDSKTRSPEYVSLADGHTRADNRTAASQSLINTISSNGVCKARYSQLISLLITTSLLKDPAARTLLI